MIVTNDMMLMSHILKNTSQIFDFLSLAKTSLSIYNITNHFLLGLFCVIVLLFLHKYTASDQRKKHFCCQMLN